MDAFYLTFKHCRMQRGALHCAVQGDAHISFTSGYHKLGTQNMIQTFPHNLCHLC